MTSEPRRLHVAAVLAGALNQLRGLIVPIVIAALIGGRGGGESLTRGLLYTAIGALATTGIAGLRWWTTRWWIDDSLHLRAGVLSETITSVPLERVQAVDSVYGPIQRLFGVVELHIQSAGGGRKAEIVLSAVTAAEADEVREAVRQAGGEGRDEEPAVAEARPEWRLERRSLLAAAATSGSLGVLVPVVAAASQMGQNLFGAQAAEKLVPSGAGQVIRDLLLVIAAAWLLSFAGTLAAFAGFRLERDGERLRIRRGILERRDASVPVARVQALRVVEGPLREPFGLAQVRIDTAGYANEPATAQTLIPLARRSELPALVASFLPEFTAEIDALERLPRRAARRYALPLALPGLVAALATAIVLGPAWLLLLVVAAAGAGLGLARHRAAGWRLDGAHIVVRNRRLARTTAIADASRLQHVDVAVNPLQRRARLATLGLAIGSGRRFQLRHLGDTTAADLFGVLGRRALGSDAAEADLG